MAERALVIGASGLVGSCLLEALRRRGVPAAGTYRRHALPGLEHLDLLDAGELSRALDRHRPAVVYCPAAEPNVELCELRQGETWAANVGSAERLAAEAARRGARLVYFSSDYVFDGEAGPYREDDPPSPVSAYGRQKLAAERAVGRARANVIVRTTVVYGWEPQGKNFVARLVERLGRGERMKVPSDQLGSPTYAPNLAEVAVALGQGGARGLFHVVGPEVLDRHAFAVLAARAFGLDPGLLDPVSTESLGQVARRPLRAGMIPTRAERATGIAMTRAEEGLRRMKEIRRGTQ
jgi:dTDP-4-dehydrorhamnose reductase